MASSPPAPPAFSGPVPSVAPPVPPARPGRARVPLALTLAAFLYGLCIVITLIWFVAFIDCDDCVFTDLVFFGIETVVLGPFAVWWYIARRAPNAEGLHAKLEWATASYMQRLLDDEDLRSYQTTAAALAEGNAPGQVRLRARTGQVVGAILCGVLMLASIGFAIGFLLEADVASRYPNAYAPQTSELMKNLAFVAGLIALGALVGLVLFVRAAVRNGRAGRSQVAADFASLQEIEFKALKRARDNAPVGSANPEPAPRVTYRRFA